MELELKISALDTYEAVNSMTLTQEETAETIVPDYCPDIARIVRADGNAYLHSREIRDGKAELSGMVRVHVVYMPEGEKGLRSLELTLPFASASEKGSFPHCRHLAAEAEVGALDVRMLNPRKISTRCKLMLRMTGHEKQQLMITEDVEAEDGLCLEKRREMQKLVLLSHIAEKDFTFSDEMLLSPGRKGAAELLTSSIQSTVSDAKVVGNKLVVKGSFRLTLLYRTQDGDCACSGAELPFSQILDVEGVGEGATAQVSLQLTGSDLQLSGEDPEGRTVAVTLYVHATAYLHQHEEVSLLKDLYSTQYQTGYEAQPLQLTEVRDTMLRRQTVRELLEIGVVAESVLMITTQCGAVSVGREGHNSVLRTNVNLRALYQDEGGAVLMAERTVEVSCHLDLPEECHVKAEAFCVEDAQSSIGDRGIEVRFCVDFAVCMEQKVKRIGISGVKVDTETPKDTANAPSLVLRCIHRQESLWDMAKTYHTTIPAILAANQLEREEDIPYDQLLLIPKKRA